MNYFSCFIFLVLVSMTSGGRLNRQNFETVKSQGRYFVSNKLNEFIETAKKQESLASFFENLSPHVINANKQNDILTTELHELYDVFKLLVDFGGVGFNCWSALEGLADYHVDALSCSIRMEFIVDWIELRVSSVKNEATKTSLDKIVNDFKKVINDINSVIEITDKMSKKLNEITEKSGDNSIPQELIEIFKEIIVKIDDKSFSDETKEAVQVVKELIEKETHVEVQEENEVKE